MYLFLSCSYFPLFFPFFTLYILFFHLSPAPRSFHLFSFPIPNFPLLSQLSSLLTSLSPWFPFPFFHLSAAIYMLTTFLCFYLPFTSSFPPLFYFSRIDPFFPPSTLSCTLSFPIIFYFASSPPFQQSRFPNSPSLPPCLSRSILFFLRQSHFPFLLSLPISVSTPHFPLLSACT